MPKKRAEGASKGGAPPVMNLKIEGPLGDAEVREVTESTEDSFKTPCSITGVVAGLSGGTLGYVFGFGGYWMRTRTQGAWRASLAEGWASGKTFAIMGGLYAMVSCFMLRLRQKQDAWNGAASGCATGLALGWSGGPASALRSCALLGAFSFFIDGMAGGEAAASAPGAPPSSGRRRERSAAELLLSPAIPLVGALLPCRGQGGGNAGGEGHCNFRPW